MVKTSLPPPDPKPAKRVKDPELLRVLHNRWRSCAVCGSTEKLSLHHIVKHPRNDVEPNLVMLCGDGVRGCHGAIERHHGPTVKLLMNYIVNQRVDTMTYLISQMGEVAAADWLNRQMTS